MKKCKIESWKIRIDLNVNVRFVSMWKNIRVHVCVVSRNIIMIDANPPAGILESFFPFSQFLGQLVDSCCSEQVFNSSRTLPKIKSTILRRLYR